MSAHIDDLTLASLLSSKICHDLVGPVGALNNGIEIINDGADADLKEHAFQLVTTSARQAAARLQFFRAAFGAGGSLGEMMQVQEIQTLTGDFLDGSRVALEWSPSENAISRDAVRLLLNLMLIGVDSLPRGGRLRMGAVQRGGMNLIIMAEGRNATLSERAREILRTGQFGERLEAKESALLLTQRIAQQIGAELTFGQEEERVVVAAAL
ncbi:MAG: histidine phosphotransferase family protein [Neomegalonema sp.]|nr:histidine phosphotransferase family protein [Neomegalonema sp.]